MMKKNIISINNISEEITLCTGHSIPIPELYKMFFKEYPDILFVSHLSEILGVSEKTVLKILNSGKLQSFKAGREYRVAKFYLLEYMGILAKTA